MRAIVVGLLCFVCVASGCGFLPSTGTGEDPDLQQARQRWEALAANDYTIEQRRTCECLPPYAYTVVVRSSRVDTLLYDAPGETYGVEPGELYEIALQSALTVDEAFELIEEEMDDAAAVEVTYHRTYGYPTDIYIDRDAQMVDDEISRTMTNLELPD